MVCGRLEEVTGCKLDVSIANDYLKQDSPGPSSAQTTPSHAATPTSIAGGNAPSMKSNGGEASASAKNASVSSKNKKKSGGGSKNTKGKNQTDDLSDEDKPPVKRLKISYGRD